MSTNKIRALCVSNAIQGGILTGILITLFAPADQDWCGPAAVLPSTVSYVWLLRTSGVMP